MATRLYFHKFEAETLLFFDKFEEETTPKKRSLLFFGGLGLRRKSFLLDLSGGIEKD